MFYRILASIFFVIFGFCYTAHAADTALFVWNLDKKQILSSKSQMDKLIDFAYQKKIKTLFVQVYRANKAWFPTQRADTYDYDYFHQGSNNDSFAYLIKEAHKKGIKVHAWMNMLSLGANTEAPILKKYGSGILTQNRELKEDLGDYKIDGQFFLEPSDLRVHKELLILVEDLLKRQKDLDGIQFDYIRYPDVHPFYGYSADNIERFKKQFGVDEIKEEDPKWKQFKRDQVTDLLKELVQKARSINPKIHVSTTGCLSYSRAYHEALQDWPRWLKENIVEFVTVMNYPPDLAEFKKNVDEIKVKVGEDFQKVNVAVGAYKFVSKNSRVFKKQFNYCQQSGAKGCVVFHYSNLDEDPSLAEALKK